MNNNIYYKIIKCGGAQIYKYKDATQVEVISKHAKKAGMVISDINLDSGIYHLTFDLDIKFLTDDEELIYTETQHNTKRHLNNGYNKICIFSNNKSVRHLFFIIENASIQSKFVISNLCLHKQNTIDEVNLMLNCIGVFSICFQKESSVVANKIKKMYNLVEEYNIKNPCLFVFPGDFNKIKQHKGDIYVCSNDKKEYEKLKDIPYKEFACELIKDQVVKKNIEEVVQIPLTPEPLTLTQTQTSTFMSSAGAKKEEQFNVKSDVAKEIREIREIREIKEITKVNEQSNIFGENLSFNKIMSIIASSPNIKKINIFKSDAKLYQIEIYDYKSMTNTISKCYVIENTNDDKCKISLIPYSNISPLLDINYLFIDTNRYMREFVIAIYNTKEEINIGEVKISEADANHMRTECINLKTKYDDKSKIYLENKEKKYNVLSIMDEFSSECFSYELNITHLTKQNINKINPNDYDFFLCESAWHGFNGDWSGLLVNFDKPVSSNLKKFVLSLKIPKVFYGKEDPINFERFKECAKYFNGDNDLVLTTDCSIVSEYIKLGCKNVIYYPFCCQPVIHNPINRNDNDNIIFPCSWYGAKYPERCVYMKDMIDKYIKTNKLDIFDRQYLFNKLTMQTDDPVVARFKNWYCFPDEYVDIIKGQLSYHQVLNSYKNYGIVMNANTITDSDTMFSRRVIEAFACGCSVITNKSVGMEKIFDNAYIEYNTVEGLKLMEDQTFRNNIQYTGHTKVMKEYTYEKLVNAIENVIFRSCPSKIPSQKSKNVLIVYLYKGEIKRDTLDNFSKYSIIKYDILSQFVFTDSISAYDYVCIMGDWFKYEPDYVENSIIPFSFADIKVTGKACYQHKNYLIGKQFENRFTNSLHPFTVVFNKSAAIQILNKNIFNNVVTYLRNVNSSQSYSYYRNGFYDGGTFCGSFKIDKPSFISKGNTVANIKNIIIMCNWKRSNRIKKILNNLSRQTNRNFVFGIWNNNSDDANYLLRYLSENNANSFQIVLYNSQINIGGFGRFLMARFMIDNSDVENVMFFDDDQDIPNDFVQTYSSKIMDTTALNFFGRKFIKGKPYCVVDSNNKIISTLSNACVANVVKGDEYDYGGTGGMCVKAFIFENQKLFSIPMKFLFCEDIWLSWIEHSEYKMKIIKSGINIDTLKDNLDQCNTLWNVKNEFLEFLRSVGWGV